MSVFLNDLNEQQQLAVQHSEGPAMVLAGAGSGKTTVLTNRVAWLLSEKNIDPFSILLVTFTNKAAGEMKSRVQNLTGMTLPLSGTFHSICAQVLRRHGKQIGLQNNFIIYDTDDQLSLLKQIYKDNGFSKTEFKINAVKSAISKAKNELLSWQRYQEIAVGRYQEHVAKVYKLYQRELDKIGAVDFDDLLNKTIDLFNQSEPVLQKYQRTIEHVLVDEYQDTNKAQYILSKLLTHPQNNIYVVGDFSQSIYAWRGADYRNMLSLKTDFKNITEYRLEQNYRSTQTILDAATYIISQNTNHPILHLWTQKRQQNQITLYEAENRKDEATRVVTYIKTHMADLPLSQMAILYRTNAQSRAFEEAFVRAGIPYRVIGGQKFYERKEIKDILAYLKLLVNESDSVSHTRAEKIGKRRLAAFQKWKETILKNYNFNQLNPAKVIEEIIDITTYKKKFDPKDTEDLSRLENIQELINVSSQFSDIVQLLENIALVQNDQLLDVATTDSSNAISLMSLHAAKGLEFEIVFMTGMEDGLLPHSRSLFSKEEMEEERRLCYVGITRAKQKLYFTYAKKQFNYNGVSSHIKSRFLHDVPDNLIEKISPQYSKYSSPSQFNKTNTQRRYVPIDDDTLDSVLSGEIDIESFLNN